MIFGLLTLVPRIIWQIKFIFYMNSKIFLLLLMSPLLMANTLMSLVKEKLNLFLTFKILLLCMFTHFLFNYFWLVNLQRRWLLKDFFFRVLYYLSRAFKKFQSYKVSFSPSLFTDYVLWHRQLTHPSPIVLFKPMLVLGSNSLSYDTCHFSKSTRLPFHYSLSKENKMFDIVHSDICEPTMESFDIYKYFSTFVDGYS